MSSIRAIFSYTLLLLGLGSWLIALYLYSLRWLPQTLAFDQTPVASAAALTQPLPTTINIPVLNLSLPIHAVSLTSENWPTLTGAIAYAVESPVPGQSGNSILYGHNWPRLLGSLKQITVGDTIEIRFEDGTSRRFQVDRVMVVTPDQTHILGPSDQPQITLYTCTGFLDLKRLVVVAVPSPN